MIRQQANQKKQDYMEIFDFIVDYKKVIGVQAVYDMQRYLMIKHDISP